MKYLSRTLPVLGMLSFLVAIWFVYRFNDHPAMGPYSKHFLVPGKAIAGMHVTFLGVSTLLFDDGTTAILTDGFFTRPGKLRTIFTKIGPDRALVARYLKRAGIKSLAAVIVVHSHYDHALDAPIVAQQTGALLIGSRSTANIGRGYGLSDDRIRTINGNATMQFGRFRILLLRSRHSPNARAMGEIEEPLHPPAWGSAYKEGGSYSVLIEHDGRSALVQASAGFIEGALRDHHADIVFLGIATLGKLDETYRKAYWHEVVQTIGARRVIPIHWDDFWTQLDQPLVPLPLLLDDFDTTMAFLLKRGNQTGVDVKLLPAWIKLDPFSGL